MFSIMEDLFVLVSIVGWLEWADLASDSVDFIIVMLLFCLPPTLLLILCFAISSSCPSDQGT